MVMAVLAELPALEVLSFEDYGLAESAAFDTDWHSRIEATQSRSCLHCLEFTSGKKFANDCGIIVLHYKPKRD